MLIDTEDLKNRIKRYMSADIKSKDGYSYGDGLIDGAKDVLAIVEFLEEKIKGEG